MNSHPPPDPPPTTFHGRRAAACQRLGKGALVLAAAPIQMASRDTERPYWPDRELYYLTGLSEPGTVAVLTGGAEPRLTIFARDRDPDAELWAGPRIGPDGAGERSGADEVHPLSGLEQTLPALLADADRIFIRTGVHLQLDRLAVGALERARARGQRTGTGPRGLVDPGVVLDDLRLVKDAHELDAIRAACGVTLAGHRAGAAAIGPEVGEWTVQAAVDGTFRALGGRGPGFETIVGSGANGCVLHYVENGSVIRDGDLVLVDAGAGVGMYHGDVTRTYPASGSFSPVQRDVYQIVDAARAAGVEATAPGRSIADVHEAATRVLLDGLVDLRVLSGDVEGLMAEGAHKAFFPHQTSHWLGLDVHDPGDYSLEGTPRRLETGMVFTVEPGLYFRPGFGNEAAAALEGIGVRVEDDVAVTDDGVEVLTGSLPTDVDEVESLVGAP